MTTWADPRTWSSCEVVTASILNTHLRNNLNQSAPAKIIDTGDMVVGDSSHSLARVGTGSSDFGKVWGAASSLTNLVGWRDAAESHIHTLDENDSQFDSLGPDNIPNAGGDVFVSENFAVGSDSSHTLNSDSLTVQSVNDRVQAVAAGWVWAAVNNSFNLNLYVDGVSVDSVNGIFEGDDTYFRWLQGSRIPGSTGAITLEFVATEAETEAANLTLGHAGDNDVGDEPSNVGVGGFVTGP